LSTICFARQEEKENRLVISSKDMFKLGATKAYIPVSRRSLSAKAKKAIQERVKLFDLIYFLRLKCSSKFVSYQQPLLGWVVLDPLESWPLEVEPIGEASSPSSINQAINNKTRARQHY
tara:strand:- start:299 stop:655 length:357 start_codon:yes stop_codon:yes gene_type:complete